MSKFKEWIDYANIATAGNNQNILDSTTFASDTERESGFYAGETIHSILVNSGLRQANLVVAALMNLTGNTTLDLTSQVGDVETALSNYLASLSVSRAETSSKIEFTTTAPTESPAAGTLLIYVGTSLPSTQYDRVLYLITN